MATYPTILGQDGEEDLSLVPLLTVFVKPKKKEVPLPQFKESKRGAK